jgi:hypothetical protein
MVMGMMVTAAGCTQGEPGEGLPTDALISSGASTEAPSASPGNLTSPSATDEPAATPSPAAQRLPLATAVGEVIEPPGRAPDSLIPDTPGIAELLSGPLPPRTLPGLEIYPVFTTENRGLADESTKVGFIDAQGTTIVDPAYLHYEDCLGPHGQAVAVLARESGTTWAVLDPATGVTRFTFEAGSYVRCPRGVSWAIAVTGEDSPVPDPQAPPRFTSVIDLETGEILLGPEEIETVSALDSASVVLVEEDMGATLLDLRSGQRTPLPGSPILDEAYTDEPLLDLIPVEDPSTQMVGFVGRDGMWVIDPTYYWADAFHQGYAWVWDSGEQATLIGPDGSRALGPYDSIDMPLPGRYVVCDEDRAAQAEEDGEKCGLLDESFAPLVEPGTGRIWIGDEERDEPLTPTAILTLADGSHELLDLDTGKRTPVPGLPTGATVMGSSPPGPLGKGRRTWVFADKQSNEYVVTEGVGTLALPVGTSADVSCSANGLIMAAVRQDTQSSFYPQLYAPTGEPLPSSVTVLTWVASVVDAGLAWVQWGPHEGYLDSHGRWLYRMEAFTQLED